MRAAGRQIPHAEADSMEAAARREQLAVYGVTRTTDAETPYFRAQYAARAEGVFAHYPAEVERARDAYTDGTMTWDDLTAVCADHDVTPGALFAKTVERDLEAGQ